MEALRDAKTKVGEAGQVGLLWNAELHFSGSRPDPCGCPSFACTFPVLFLDLYIPDARPELASRLVSPIGRGTGDVTMYGTFPVLKRPLQLLEMLLEGTALSAL